MADVEFNSGKTALDPAPITTLSRLGRVIRVASFLLAAVSIATTFLLVTGIVNVPLTENRILILVVGTTTVALVLFCVVFFDVIRLFQQLRRRSEERRVGKEC